jgi:lysine 2,3-aminomutase
MNWQKELKTNIKSIKKLQNFINFDKNEIKKIKEVVKYHPLSISRYYLSLIDRNNKNDPIKKMMIPSSEELLPGGDYDPSKEKANTKLVGLQHKYSETALLLITNRCASYCRYCFRKRMIALSTDEIIKKFSDAIKYIKNHTEINNVLLSGGDPLTLSTKLLNTLLSKLSKIEHLNFIRIGTKVPVSFPNRIINDNELLEVLKQINQKKRIYITTHFNHNNEITEKSTEAIEMLIKSGILVNNQSVLLKDINDNAQKLGKLQKNLVKIGINPYYIFQCRPAMKVKNQFQVPIYKGIKITEEAKKYMDGYSKKFRYILSHTVGKFHILGNDDKRIYFKYYEVKDKKYYGKIFSRKIDKNATWLSEKKLKLI